MVSVLGLQEGLDSVEGGPVDPASLKEGLEWVGHGRNCIHFNYRGCIRTRDSGLRSGMNKKEQRGSWKQLQEQVRPWAGERLSRDLKDKRN